MFALDLLLMALVAVAVVIGLPAVGVVLMAALLIMPGAAARFWTDRLSTLLRRCRACSASAWAWSALAQRVARSAAGRADHRAVGHGAVRGVAAVWHAARRSWPAGSISGGLRRAGPAAAAADRVGASKQPIRRQPRAADSRRPSGPQDLDRGTCQRIALRRPSRRVWCVRSRRDELFELTPDGREQALAAMRGHRLWEAFLTEYPDQAGSTANLASLSIEDYVPPAVVEQLTTQSASRGSLAGDAGRRRGRESLAEGGHP